MAKSKWMKTTPAVLAIVGGAAWLTTGLFNYNFIAQWFDFTSWLPRTLYTLAGASTLWLGFKNW